MFSTHSLRIDAGTKTYLMKKAKESGRSLHAEIIMRINGSIERDNESDVFYKSNESEHSGKIIELLIDVKKQNTCIIDHVNNNAVSKKIIKSWMKTIVDDD